MFIRGPSLPAYERELPPGSVIVTFADVQLRCGSWPDASPSKRTRWPATSRLEPAPIVPLVCDL